MVCSVLYDKQNHMLMILDVASRHTVSYESRNSLYIISGPENTAHIHPI